MLARMAQADAQRRNGCSIFVIERADVVELLGQRRRGFGDRRSRAGAPIWPGNQGWPCAPRPIMTASAPDISSAVTAFVERA